MMRTVVRLVFNPPCPPPSALRFQEAVGGKSGHDDAIVKSVFTTHVFNRTSYSPNDRRSFATDYKY